MRIFEPVKPLRNVLTVSAAVLLLALRSGQASAATINFTFTGPGVSGAVALTYGAAADSKYPQAFEVTGISGFFSDSNNGLNIVSAPITSLEAIRRDPPETSNLLAPRDFSRFAVTAGLPDEDNGSLSFDNLFYPNGSPQTASDYPVHGGFLDIYGLLFDIGGGRVVNVWSNGDFGTGAIDYGVAVATPAKSLDYVGGGVAASPEPGAFVLLAGGLGGLVTWRRARKSRLV